MSSIVLQDLSKFGPQRCDALSIEQAQAYTQALVRSQYENFTVISKMLPGPLRQAFSPIYAFCRWADDLGDEVDDRDRAEQLLKWWRSELDRCYDQKPRHPVFVALGPIIQKHQIPRKPFDDLIDAFVQDQHVTRYESWQQVLDYCTRSANPVGRLVLYVCGYRDEQRQQLSDATCTALQLANFWQDIRRDVLQRDRVYVPSEIAGKHGLDIATMVQVIRADNSDDGHCSACSLTSSILSAGVSAVLPAYRATVKELVDRTWPRFEQGRELWPMVRPEVRVDIELFTRGGEAVLRKIEKAKYDTLTHRPVVSKTEKLWLFVRSSAARLVHRGQMES